MEQGLLFKSPSDARALSPLEDGAAGCPAVRQLVKRGRKDKKYSFDHKFQKIHSNMGLSFFCSWVSLQFKKQEN